MTICHPMFPPPLAPDAPRASRRALLMGLAAAVAVPAPVVASILAAPAVPAVAAAPAAPSLPIPEPASPGDGRFLDATLVERIKEYLAAAAELEKLEQTRMRLHREHWAKYPMPDAMLVQPKDEALAIPNIMRMHFEAQGATVVPPDHRCLKDYDDACWIRALERPRWERLVEIELPPEGDRRFYGFKGGAALDPTTRHPRHEPAQTRSSPPIIIGTPSTIATRGAWLNSTGRRSVCSVRSTASPARSRRHGRGHSSV